MSHDHELKVEACLESAVSCLQEAVATLDEIKYRNIGTEEHLQHAPEQLDLIRKSTEDSNRLLHDFGSAVRQNLRATGKALAFYHFVEIVLLALILSRVW